MISIRLTINTAWLPQYFDQIKVKNLLLSPTGFSFKDWLFPLHTPKVHFYWLEPLLVLAASRRINFGNICNNIWILETSLSTGRQSFGITGLTPLFTTANAACTAVMFWKGSKPVMSSQNYTHPPLVYGAYAESSLYTNGQVKHTRE